MNNNIPISRDGHVKNVDSTSHSAAVEQTQYKQTSEFETDTLAPIIGKDPNTNLPKSIDEPLLVKPDEKLLLAGGPPLPKNSLGSLFDNIASAVFQMIMTEISTVEQKIRFSEWMSTINLNKSMMEISKSSAEMVQLSYLKQATEKYIEATMNVMSAAISTVQLAHQGSNQTKATEKVDSQINEKKENLNKLRIDNPMSDTNNKPLSLEEHDKRLYAELPEFAKEKDAYLELVNHREQRITEYFREFNNIDKTMGEIVEQTLRSVSNFMQGFIKTEEGYIESFRSLMEGYKQMLDRYLDSVSRSKEDAKASFDKAIDLMMRIQDANLRAHSLTG